MPARLSALQDPDAACGLRNRHAGGMRSLLEDAKLKILRGVTTPEEIARITQQEGAVFAEEEVE